jgi:hypothetical protein
MDVSRLSQKTAAELLSVTPRAMRDWADAPRNRDGTYPGPLLVAWFIDRRTPDPEPEVEDQRQRLAAAQAEKVEHENAVRRGQLADTRAVEAAWTGMIANARAKLLGLPHRLAGEVPEVARATVLARGAELVHAALRDLADYGGRQ